MLSHSVFVRLGRPATRWAWTSRVPQRLRSFGGDFESSSTRRLTVRRGVHTQSTTQAKATPPETISPLESPLFTYAPRDLDLREPLPKLRYPVVLVHGYLGFASLIRSPINGRLLFEYFGSVRQHLTDHGLTVITPVNPPAASIAARAKKLQIALGIKKRGVRENQGVKGGDGPQYTEREDTAAKSSSSQQAGKQDADDEESDVPLSERKGKIEFSNTGGKKHESDQDPPKDAGITQAKRASGSSVSKHTGSVKTSQDKRDEREAETEDDGPSIVLGGQTISLSKYTGKFHLIAHSMGLSRETNESLQRSLRILLTCFRRFSFFVSSGGLDSRYLISQLQEPAADAPDQNRVLSLTTVATPHRGSPVADTILDVLDLPFTFNPKRLANAPTLNKFSQWLASWFGIDVTGINNLSTVAMRDFNSRIQNHPSVHYLSYGGARRFPWYSIWHLPSSWILDYYATHDHSTDADGICAGGENDGLVSVNSAKWGNYLGTTKLDHLEQIGLGVWNKVRQDAALRASSTSGRAAGLRRHSADGLRVLFFPRLLAASPALPAGDLPPPRSGAR
jgi:hypothetical protein